MMGYDEEIKVLRERINAIDKQLLSLFESRLDVVGKVAELKRQYNKPVYDAKREEEVIARNLSQLQNRGYSEEARRFFQALMDTSKQSEHKEMAVRASVRAPKAGSAGYLGIRGSYSHIAAGEVFGGSELVSFNSFEEMFEGLKKGEIEYAVLPAENTETGSITAVIDLLAKYGFFIVAEKTLHVVHSLLGTKDSELSDIKVVCSHPEPFGQCSDFFEAHPDIEKRSSLSTAQAAQMVAREGDKNLACIASAQAAPVYGLKVLRENIQNSGSNYTRFIIIAKKPCGKEGCDKSSIVFVTEHKPGALAEILDILSSEGVNVVKLESRPLRNKPFEYMFHLDFEGSIYDKGVMKTMEKVKEKASNFLFLGSYRKDGIQ